MKLEILRDEIRIVPESDADRLLLLSTASARNLDQAKAKLVFDVYTKPAYLVVRPFCCGEGPMRLS